MQQQSLILQPSVQTDDLPWPVEGDRKATRVVHTATFVLDKPKAHLQELRLTTDATPVGVPVMIRLGNISITVTPKENGLIWDSGTRLGVPLYFFHNPLVEVTVSFAERVDAETARVECLFEEHSQEIMDRCWRLLDDGGEYNVFNWLGILTISRDVVFWRRDSKSSASSIVGITQQHENQKDSADE